MGQDLVAKLHRLLVTLLVTLQSVMELRALMDCLCTGAAAWALEAPSLTGLAEGKVHSTWRSGGQSLGEQGQALLWASEAGKLAGRGECPAVWLPWMLWLAAPAPLSSADSASCPALAVLAYAAALPLPLLTPQPFSQPLAPVPQIL